MTRKNKQTKVKQQRPKQKNATPFRDVGGIVGNAISKYTGFTGAGGIGKWLGTGIGSIFGSGDYEMVGQAPGYNILASSKQIPKFSTTHASNVVCHREYIGDITGTAGFSNVSYPINPGMSQTFPWLSTVAQNYQQYRIHGLIFEFRPLITDFVTSGAPGVVIMATNYNADATPYNTKQAMENTEFAVSVKPTNTLIHAVECAPDENPFKIQYVRSAATPAGQDLKAFDLGLFQFATQSNPVQALGELWVSYCVEFLKPTLPLDEGGVVDSAHLYRNAVSLANPLGGIQLKNNGSITVRVTSGTVFEIATIPQQLYNIQMIWTNGAAAALAPGTLTAVGATAISFINDNTIATITQPGAGVISNSMVHSSLWRCSLLTPGTSVFTLAGWTPPLGAGFDLYITEVGATSL